MKLKFTDQAYQTDAVNAICDIFDGCEVKDSLFTIDTSKDSGIITGEGYEYFIGHSNKLTIDDFRMIENVRDIQSSNNIQMAKDLQNKNFTIEMETGTGKTYVYTKTILELNKRYGFTKFIIVVPSIAIKEGVNSSFVATNEHFKEKYDNVTYNWFVYSSDHLERIRDFATSTNIEIMIINIDAFRKSFKDKEDQKNKANVIHRESDRLSGNKPIDLIAGTNPIVIIDEPQSVDNTDKSKEAIASLNPLCTLRYSATHKTLYNLMYRLTPVDAYQQNLVKHIEVASVSSDEASTKAYVKLLSVTDNPTYSAKIELYCANKKTGAIEKKTAKVKTNDDLWEISNEVDYYKDGGFIVDNIDCFEGNESIAFSNGESVNLGQAIGVVDDSQIKRSQIRQTIQFHLRKEKNYLNKGIKVLSLFFIDEVAKYRDYDKEDQKGQYAIWFEEEYRKEISKPEYRKLIEEHHSYYEYGDDAIHEGYFSKDGKGRMVNSKGDGTSSADESTYELIMKDKERLLSLDEPVRFIFSHSALKEGWDNPNIFQVCTLIETKDTMTKRQKVGRGLRICVDQNGERVLEGKYNTLSVIANESYKEFASTLQKELETDNFKFGVIEKVSFTGLSVKQLNGERVELTQNDSEKIFDYMVANDYMTKNGKVTPKYYQDEHDGTFKLPEQYESFTTKIITQINNLSKEVEIKDASKKVEVKLNKSVQLSPDFERLWDKIKQKTVYKVNMDINKLKSEAIQKIKDMPTIKPEKIIVTKVGLDIDKSGVTTGAASEHTLATLSELDKPNYPDFIRRLQDSTQLLRKTIIEVVAKSGRLKDFYVNPEEFIKQVSKVLLEVKKENLTDGIKYEKSDELYEQDFIFNDEALYGYENRNVLEVSKDKNVYDHVIYDSQIEKQFALDAEADDEVLLYAKLPDNFKIDTPIGNYNPDWAVVLDTENGEKLYFVAETKGTDNINDLKGSEKKKIFCGRKHFEVIDTGIKYEVVKELKTLKNR